MYLEEKELNEIDSLINVSKYTPYARCYAYDRHGNMMLDYNNKPRILTVKSGDNGIVTCYQVSVPFTMDGEALAKVTSWWYKCSIKLVDEIDGLVA